jgi:arylsulfatase A-like enzyme
MIDRYKTIPDKQRRSYAAMITALDDQVGRIVAELDKRVARQHHHSSPATMAARPAACSPAARRARRSATARKAASNKAQGAGLERALQRRQGGLREGGVRVPAFVNWPGKLKPGVVGEPLHMVDVMPTILALAGGNRQPGPSHGRQRHVEDAGGRRAVSTDDVLINVEAFRGAIRKGDWKLIKLALLPGKTELFNLATDPGETTNVAADHPDVVRDLEARLVAYARQQKPSEWMKAQPAFVGAQGHTVMDPDFDIGDGGLPQEKARLPRR